MPLRKFINWVTEELIIRRLSNNRKFQQFAVKMDDTIQANKSKVNEHVTKVKGGTSGFFQTFIEDVKKEMQNIESQQQQQAPKK